MLRAAALLAAALVAASQDPTEKERKDYVDTRVDGAITKGLQALKGMQRPSGRFEWYGQAVHGATGLALYTFLASGKTLEEPAAAKALDWILNNPPPWQQRREYDVYEYSLIAVALSYAIPAMKDGLARNEAVSLLRKTADWLSNAQLKGGGWSYNAKNDGHHDHSNTQFAVLGLRAAANAGARVKSEVWEREVTHYKTSQLKDGGWAYQTCYKDQQGTGRSTSTMTAAGVMGLAMALGSKSPSTRTEQLAADNDIKQGLESMKAHWSDGTLERGGIPNYYLLYSIERACMITGQRLLGEIDWYTEGAFLLLRAQNPDGIWGNGQDQVVQQCFALLFLKRAYVPVATPSNVKSGDVTKPATPIDTDRPREME
jgi:hypothetical protein